MGRSNRAPLSRNAVEHRKSSSTINEVDHTDQEIGFRVVLLGRVKEYRLIL